MSIQAYYPITNIWFYLVVVAALEAQAVYTWQFRNMPGAKMAAYSQGCKAIWLLALVLSSIHAELPVKLLWIAIQKMAVVSLPYLWLLFTLQISQQQKLIPSVIKHCISGILGCLLLVILLNWNELIWRQAWLDEQTVMLVGGTGQWVAQVYGYLLGITTTVLAMRWVVITAGLRRRRALLYLLAVLISWASHFIWKFSGGSIQAMPWGFLINGVIVTWIYYRWHLYDILPLAQDVAARNVIEGLLIIDEQDYIVEMNPAARLMLNGLPVAVGGGFQAAAAAWRALAEADGALGGEIVEAVRERLEGCRHYELKRITLHTPKNHSLGRIILLRDITEQKRDQSQMVEQQKSVAIMEERASLARELHDNLCQVLGYINVQSQSVRELAASGQTAATVSGLSRLTDVAQQAYDDVREYIRDVQTAKMIEKGFVEALREYIGQVYLAHGLEVKLDIPENFDRQLLSAFAAMQLLRIAQEALTNIRKHAEASHILLTLMVDAAVVRIIVADDGKGFDAAACAGGVGFGLTTMRERAEKLGGKLEITSIFGQGTTVAVEVPRPEK